MRDVEERVRVLLHIIFKNCSGGSEENSEIPLPVPEAENLIRALREWKAEVLTTQQRMLHAAGPAVPTAVIPWVCDCQISDFHGCSFSHCALLG
jgi:hypothetical protein